MEKKGYREPIKASLEEILERNAQINEIKERSAVDAFNVEMNQKFRSYCEINGGKRRGKCYVH